MEPVEVPLGTDVPSPFGALAVRGHAKGFQAARQLTPRAT
jgi:hypothetical protein